MKRLVLFSFFIIFLISCSDKGAEPTFVNGDSIKQTDYGGRFENQNYKGETIWFSVDSVFKKIVNGVTHEIMVVEVYPSDNACAIAVDQDVIIAEVGRFESVNGVIIHVKQIEKENDQARVLVEIGQPLLVGYR